MLKKATSGAGAAFTGGDVTSALTPNADDALSVGTAAKRFANGHFTTVNSGAFTAPATTAMVLTADVANSGSNAGFTFNNTTALSGNTLLARFGSNASYKVNIEDDGSVVPVSTGVPSLGSATGFWAITYTNSLRLGSTGTVVDTNGNTRLTLTQSGGAGINTYTSRVADGGTAIAHTFINANALSTAGAKIASFHSGNGSSEKVFIDKDGQVENTVSGNGIILKSPDGTRYRLTIANGGTVSIAAA